MSIRGFSSAYVRHAAPVVALAVLLSTRLHAAPTGLDVYARSGVQGTPLSGYAASFATTEASPSIVDLTATVDWGDGTVSPANIETSGFPGLFAVSATHTYVSAGNYQLSVSVFDSSDSGSAFASNTVTIQNAALQVSGLYFQSTPNVGFNGTVATFVDENPYATIGDFTATINWGDGATTSGSIMALGAGNDYSVAGIHTYAIAGLKAVTIDVTDGNNSNHATGTSYTGDRIFANGFD